MSRPALALLLASLVAPSLAFAKGLKPGQYNSTTNMEVGGRKMPPVQRTRCVTAEEAADTSQFLKKAQQDPSCQLVNLKSGPTKVSADLTCAKEGSSAKGHIEATIGETTVDWTVTMDAESARSGPMHISATTHAERAGDCTK